MAEYCFDGFVGCEALSIKERISLTFQDKGHFCCVLNEYVVEFFLKKGTNDDTFEIDTFVDYALCSSRVSVGLHEHISINYQTIKNGNYQAMYLEGTIFIPQRIVQEHNFFFPFFSTILPPDIFLSHLIREYYEKNIISMLYFDGCFGL